LLNQLKTFNQ